MSGGVFSGLGGLVGGVVAGAINGGVQGAANALIDDVYALIFSPVRMIGTIMPGVVVEELHRDDLVITDHPVERGAAISDHAFKLPSTVEMRCGWSDTQGGPGYVQQVYQELLDLQATREPFDVYTGKRVYNNMLIRSLAVSTDEKSETALMVVCALREIIIVDTQTLSKKGAQRDPSKTASETDKGTKQPITATSFAGNFGVGSVGDGASFAGPFSVGTGPTGI